MISTTFMYLSNYNEKNYTLCAVDKEAIYSVVISLCSINVGFKIY